MITKSGSYDISNLEEAVNNRFKENEETNNKQPYTNLKQEELSTTVANSLARPSTNEIQSTFNDKTNYAFQKSKRSFIGIPLTFLAYFSAIYTLLAYGVTSLLSIYELMINNSIALYPLYILLVGYLLITIMSFVLIVAIQKELLNLILLWIIVMCVFVLPEIGLNIILVENSLGWFENSTSLYTLVALIVRILINMPCIFLVLMYQINRTKRKKYFHKILSPLKKNIVNGEVLRLYNNVKLESTDQQLSSLANNVGTTDQLTPQNISVVSNNFEKNKKINNGNANQKSTEGDFKLVIDIPKTNVNENHQDILNQIDCKLNSNSYVNKFKSNQRAGIFLKQNQQGVEFLQHFQNSDLESKNKQQYHKSHHQKQSNRVANYENLIAEQTNQSQQRDINNFRLLWSGSNNAESCSNKNINQYHYDPPVNSSSRLKKIQNQAFYQNLARQQTNPNSGISHSALKKQQSEQVNHKFIEGNRMSSKSMSMSTPTIDKILNRADKEHFDYFNRMEKSLNQVPGIKRNPVFFDSTNETPLYLASLIKSNSYNLSKMRNSNKSLERLNMPHNNDVPEYEGEIIQINTNYNSRSNFSQTNSFPMPLIGSSLSTNQRIKYLNRNFLPNETSNNEFHHQPNSYANKINFAKHQIYLPPAPTFSITGRNVPCDTSICESVSSNVPSVIESRTCNCVNIASCNKKNLTCLIHSKNCFLYDKNQYSIKNNTTEVTQRSNATKLIF